MTKTSEPEKSIGLYMDPHTHSVTSRSIFVTGAARTGTTAMAQLLHTHAKTEYLHEPSVLNLMIPAIDLMAPVAWQVIFESYLYEEGLMEAVSGRRMNLNRHDQSSLWHAKTAKEIRSRLEHSFRRQEATDLCVDRRLVLKLPDMMPYIPTLHKYYPQMNIIVMLRKPESIMSSIIERGWYRDVGEERAQGVYPWKSPGSPYLPFWISNDDIGQWETMSEIERTCLHYITIHQSLLDHIETLAETNDHLILIDYDDFTSDTGKFLPQISEALGLEAGEKTAKNVQNFREPAKQRFFATDKIPVSTLDNITCISRRLRHECEQQWARMG